jgi:hypothetical protein
LRPLIIPIDADQRLEDIEHIVDPATLVHFSDDPQDHVDPDRMLERLKTLMAEAKPGEVGTIAYDSVTTPWKIVTGEIQAELDAGKHKNRIAPQARKANAMSDISLIGQYGTDVVWTLHHFTHFDQNAQKGTRVSISESELQRFMYQVNMELHFFTEGGRYGLRIAACRLRPEWEPKVIWDKRGNFWRGVPEAIEQAVYGSVPPDEQERIAAGRPAYFTTPELAIDFGVNFHEVIGEVTIWAFEDPTTPQGLKAATAHATNAYHKLRSEQVEPVVSDKAWQAENTGDRYAKARWMARCWTEDLDRRVAEKAAHLRKGEPAE